MTGALNGIRVVDFTWNVAGPEMTRILADLGADVIKVEYEGRLDALRLSHPLPGDGASPNRAPLFTDVNRNKRGVTVNIFHPDGMALVKRLIAMSDVVAENFSSRVMERWGLDYSGLAAIKSDIIYVSLSGFGHSGRDRDYTTYGPTAQALSGLTAMCGLPGKPPAGIGFSYLDHFAGYYGAAAVLLALHYREQTGNGQYIDISQLEVGLTLTGTAILDATVNGRPYCRKGNRETDERSAPHGIYPCAGHDAWCAISVFSDAEWSALCDVLGASALAHDLRFASTDTRLANQDALDPAIAELTVSWDAYALMEGLQAHGVAAGVVQSPQQRVDRDPQLRSRSAFWEMDHPELGRRLFTGSPLRLSETPARPRAPSPLLGQHNGQVYRELLRLNEEEITRLQEEGAIA